MPKSRHRKGFQPTAFSAGVLFQRIDAHRHRLHTEGSPPCFPYVPVSYEETPSRKQKGVAVVTCHREFFSPSRAQAQASAPVQKTRCYAPAEQRQSRAPVASVPGAFAPPGKEGHRFFQAHPSTAACAATHKSQRRHWRLADSDDALTWLSPLSRAQFLPRDGVK
jgi:hypothetical protein